MSFKTMYSLSRDVYLHMQIAKNYKCRKKASHNYYKFIYTDNVGCMMAPASARVLEALTCNIETQSQ